MNIFFSFSFSFLGSLTPGTVNLSVLQTGLTGKPAVGIRMAAAAALVEYMYAWLAVKSEAWITGTPLIYDNMQLIAATVMTVLGVLTIFSASVPSNASEKFNNSGFIRGIVIGVLNPLAMPYWIGITAYMRSMHWVTLDTNLQLHSYLLGVSLGVFTLLCLVAFGAKKLSVLLADKINQVKKIPGFLMLGLGIFAFIRYAWHHL